MTQQYPEVRPDLPARSRGVIALVEENCTVCMLCARECPDWCIYIDSHKETLPAPEGGRPRARNVLDRFAIDFSLCMYCGICIEVCPFDALFWSPEFEYAEGDIRNLVHEKDRLAAWAQTVPPPPAHELNADPPKELAAASRPARPTPGPAGSRPARPAPGRSPGKEEPPSVRSPGKEELPSARGADDEGPAPGRDSGEAAGGARAGGEDEQPGSSSDEPSARQAGTDRPDRPVRRTSAGHANVRAIRPPGSLPKKDDSPTARSLSTEPTTERPAADRPSTDRPDLTKSSTAESGAPPADGPTEQTSATDPDGATEEES
ncbi:hypothetical protein Plo01_26190 [Planobispora longispora]|uniref:4Fe-4S ferredoxin-type domain-containing protein n=1 Tax=Planobispora longispora TaxID=28887 RepID=A0A8J3W547_9ACTN|nr:hypothetical protein Plo01_26190 [Planobispora longispora]